MHQRKVFGSPNGQKITVDSSVTREKIENLRDSPLKDFLFYKDQKTINILNMIFFCLGFRSAEHHRIYYCKVFDDFSNVVQKLTVVQHTYTFLDYVSHRNSRAQTPVGGHFSGRIDQMIWKVFTIRHIFKPSFYNPCSFCLILIRNVPNKVFLSLFVVFE